MKQLEIGEHRIQRQLGTAQVQIGSECGERTESALHQLAQLPRFQQLRAHVLEALTLGRPLSEIVLSYLISAASLPREVS